MAIKGRNCLELCLVSRVLITNLNRCCVNAKIPELDENVSCSGTVDIGSGISD